MMNAETRWKRQKLAVVEYAAKRVHRCFQPFADLLLFSISCLAFGLLKFQYFEFGNSLGRFDKAFTIYVMAGATVLALLSMGAAIAAIFVHRFFQKYSLSALKC